MGHCIKLMFLSPATIHKFRLSVKTKATELITLPFFLKLVTWKNILLQLERSIRSGVLKSDDFGTEMSFWVRKMPGNLPIHSKQYYSGLHFTSRPSRGCGVLHQSELEIWLGTRGKWIHSLSPQLSMKSQASQKLFSVLFSAPPCSVILFQNGGLDCVLPCCELNNSKVNEYYKRNVHDCLKSESLSHPRQFPFYF